MTATFPVSSSHETFVEENRWFFSGGGATVESASKCNPMNKPHGLSTKKNKALRCKEQKRQSDSIFG